MSTLYTWKCNAKYMPVPIVTKVDGVSFSLHQHVKSMCLLSCTHRNCKIYSPNMVPTKKPPFQTNDYITQIWFPIWEGCPQITLGWTHHPNVAFAPEIEPKNVVLVKDVPFNIYKNYGFSTFFQRPVRGLDPKNSPNMSERGT